MDEFSFIREYLSPLAKPSAEVPVSIGDDCAIISPTEGMQICISTDAQVEGRHFPANAPWNLVITRAVGCAVSDLSAMGARPIGMTLAISLTELDASIAELIHKGIQHARERYHCALIGGDTTYGPKQITVTVFGEVPVGRGMLRSGANDDDDIWVTGTLGDAAYALSDLNEHRIAEMNMFQQRYWFPPCYVDFAQSLLPYASSCMDLSDGLGGDIRQILRASNQGAELVSECLPLSQPLCKKLAIERAVELAITGGDDYELLFTAAKSHREALLSIAKAEGVMLTKIGSINNNTGQLSITEEGNRKTLTATGFTHF